MVRDLGKERDLRTLNVQLSASRKLGHKLQQVVWKDMEHFEADGFEFAIAYVLFLRAERTFSSIRTLARMRMVDDAFALVRVMVEKVINAEYILLAGTDTALDYIQYHAFREWRDFEELRSVSPEIAPKYTAEILDRLRSAHDRARVKTLPDGSEKQRFGRGHDWIDISLAKRAKFVDETLMKRSSMRAFKTTRILYYSTYKKGAGYVHGMWKSLARSLETEKSKDAVSEDGRVEVTLGIRTKDKNPRIAAEALSSANLAAAAMILFAGKVFNQKKYLDWASGFKESYLEALRRAKEASTER